MEKSELTASHEDTDSNEGSLKPIPKERALLESFFYAIAQFQFDRAQEGVEKEKLLDKERERDKMFDREKSTNVFVWSSLLNVLINFANAEKNYYTMAFIEKKLFKNTVKPLYVNILSDLLKLETNTYSKAKDFTDECHEVETLSIEISKQMNQFIRARLKMIDFYEFMARSGWSHLKNTQEIINCISDISKEFSKDFHHPILDPLKSCFCHEVETIHRLFHAELHLSEWDFLSSLLSLRESQKGLQAWSDLSPTSSVKEQLLLSFSKRSFFSRTIKKHSEIPFLYQWLHHLYSLLVSKFTLYFYSTLSAQAPPTDLKAATAKTSTDYISKLHNFQKKTDAARILLVLDTTTKKNVFHGHGYHLETSVHEKTDGINSYPSILSIPDNCNNFKDHWPNIISIINEKCGDVKTSDKVIYFHDTRLTSSYFCLKIDVRMTLFLIFVAKKKERDNYIQGFLADIKSSLNHDSLYAMLRPGQVKAF